MWQFEYCKPENYQEIVEFLKENWSEKHVFTKSSEMFEFQHLDSDKKQFNFLVAKKETKIGAIIGFINTRHFDKTLETKDYWGAIWKIDDSNPDAVGLGHMIFKKLLKLEEPESYAAIGISDVAKDYYKRMGYYIGNLDHYYCLNEKLKNSAIAKNVKVFPKNEDKGELKIKEISDLNSLNLVHMYTPQKSINYITNRYKKHPVYTYRFLGVYNRSKIEAVLVIRKQFVESSSCLRIVDVFGDCSSLSGLYGEFQILLTKENSEYIDCLNHGIDESIFESMGFQKLDFEGEIIIPNYFEPFLQENIKIEFAVKSKYEKYVVFKGDSDQDRPNLI